MDARNEQALIRFRAELEAHGKGKPLARLAAVFSEERAEASVIARTQLPTQRFGTSAARADVVHVVLPQFWRALVSTAATHKNRLAKFEEVPLYDFLSTRMDNAVLAGAGGKTK